MRDAEQLRELMERRDEIAFLMIEADNYEYKELELELAELDEEISALGGEKIDQEEEF